MIFKYITFAYKYICQSQRDFSEEILAKALRKFTKILTLRILQNQSHDFQEKLSNLNPVY